MAKVSRTAQQSQHIVYGSQSKGECCPDSDEDDKLGEVH